ncbi:MAG TPA: HAD hydrolase-like protein [Sedimentisphaerales bacterium]|jgi:phosphoglycolate phosphatase-like HAD superfamily hydrolase|nr:HAD hydrolase-like protein [Sedimentisphaerales bacterium]HNU27752.1 HAD hydrolase-like protein [Sedimentisphaerales bacterium]
MGYRYIIFDFDGVLAESNEIRFQGFRELFGHLAEDQMARFMDFVCANGGLSRYGKIRHLYENILCRPISDEEVAALARQYSAIVMQKVIAAPPVPGSLEFLGEHKGQFEFAVISGSDQEELRQVCKARGIDQYFREILGSPSEKSENIEGLLARENWDRRACLYVGDSQNDHDAAVEAGIGFIGRNSGVRDWNGPDVVSIASLRELPVAIEELSRRRRNP